VPIHRVLVASRPRLMRELILTVIRDQQDIEVVGETENDTEITEMVERTRPDYLIVGTGQADPMPGLCGFLLGRYPQMKILAVGTDRNPSTLYWAFVDIRTATVETSEEGMLGALRSKADVSRV
jgi:DNA-binding NarL/FixJ family response regulator